MGKEGLDIMLEWLLLPLMVSAAAFIPKGKMKDEKKIQMVFVNRNVGIKRAGSEPEYPKLVRTEKHLNKTTYVYSLPIGLPSEVMEILEAPIKEVLNKEVEWEFKDGMLHIHVFEEGLPERWDFTEDLLRYGTWEVPVGKNGHGILYHDFEKYPHVIMGGTTRFGKTVLLKGMFASLLMNQPENAVFYILDLKGGLEFARYEHLPQVAGFASNVIEACEMLAKISKELKEREKMFRESHWNNIVHTPYKQRIFIIVDEGAELSPKFVAKPLVKYAEACMLMLGEIARIGGGLGYRLIYCTQYPVKDAVPMQVKINVVTRISFIVSEQVGSMVILDSSGAEALPALPGRCIYKVEKKRIVQAPYITDEMIFHMLERRNCQKGEINHNGQETR
jgi:DNA segregation ATPase FtsK/SpoIIIE, S-DNA-T family